MLLVVSPLPPLIVPCRIAPSGFVLMVIFLLEEQQLDNSSNTIEDIVVMNAYAIMRNAYLYREALLFIASLLR